MPLDYETVHFCNSLLNVSYGVMLLIVWLRRRELHFLLWSASLLMVSAAVWCFTIADARWEVALLLGCITANVSLIWMGLRAFDGRSPFQSRILLVPVLVPVAFWITATLGEPGLARALSTGLMAINVLCVGMYLRTRSPDMGLGRTIVACSLLAYVPVYAISAMMSLSGYDNGTVGNIALVADFALNNVFVVGLFLLTEDRTRKKLQHLATTDPLTGAYNRGGFIDFVEGRLIGREVALLLVDLDHFKSVNDRFGHAAGDAVLQAFVARTRQELADGEIIGRIGGEEFAVVLPGLNWAAAAERAEDIRRAMGGSSVTWGLHSITVTVSVGVAMRVPGETLEAAMRRSDEALYRAKGEGRDRIAA